MKTKRTPLAITLSLAGTLVVLAFAGAAGHHGDLEGAGFESSSDEERGDEMLPFEASTPASANRSTAGESGRGRYSLPLGTRLDFEYHAAVQTKMSIPGSPSDEGVAFGLSGRTKVTALGRREDEIVLQIAFPDTRVKASAAQLSADPRHAQALADALAKPVDVLLRSDGEHLAYRFAEDVPPQAEAFARSLLSSFRFVVREGESEWTSVETDPTGTFEVDYRWASDAAAAAESLERRKRTFVGLPDSGPQLEIPELDCLATAHFPADLGWFASAHSKDSFRAQVIGSEFAVAFEAEYTWRLGEVSRLEAQELPLADWDSPWASAVDFAAPGAAAPDAAKRNLRHQIEGKGLQELVDELAALLEEHGPGTVEVFQAIRRLSMLLEDDPQALATLSGLLPTLSDDLAVAVLAAVARAGTEPAQSLLVTLATGLDTPPALREAAAKMMFALSEPSANTVDAALQLALDVDPVISSTGVLLLGALAGRFAEQPAAEQIMGELLASEADLADQGKSGLWLEALGNSGHPAVVEAVTPYLQSEDPAVRESAVLALRHVSGEEVSQTLAQTALADADPGIRMDAVSALSNQSDGFALKTLSTVMSNDPDVSIRKQAIAGVAGHAETNDEAVALLSSAALGDPSPDNRAFAASFLDD